MDNFSVATMILVNELADRFGIKPYDFVATIHTQTGQPFAAELRFECEPSAAHAAGFRRMLGDLGVAEAGHNAPRLLGSEKSIYRALESALERAPQKGRSR